MTRHRRRLLLALLTDATNLDAGTLARTAQVRLVLTSLALDIWELDGMVIGRWQAREDDRPRLRYYRLTLAGRQMALHELGLELRHGT